MCSAKPWDGVVVLVVVEPADRGLAAAPACHSAELIADDRSAAVGDEQTQNGNCKGSISDENAVRDRPVVSRLKVESNDVRARVYKKDRRAESTHDELKGYKSSAGEGWNKRSAKHGLCAMHHMFRCNDDDSPGVQSFPACTFIKQQVVLSICSRFEFELATEENPSLLRW